MPDISKHPILGQISELMYAIEGCGASPQLTHAVTLAEALYKSADALVDSKTAVLCQFESADDQQIEIQIQESGADTAPRVTLEQINQLMSRVVYCYEYRPNGSTVTMAHALLDGRFYLTTGVSACVSAANYNARIGQEMATANAARQAREKLWELEGYRLQVALAG